MTDITVDIEGLSALGSNLERGREQLGAALRAMADVGPAPLGTDALDEACAGFQESWAYGLGQLGKCVEAVRGGIDGTQAGYAELERVLAEGFGRMRGALGEK